MFWFLGAGVEKFLKELVEKQSVCFAYINLHFKLFSHENVDCKSKVYFWGFF